MQRTLDYLMDYYKPIDETLIAIGGVPATGKTTLMRKLMQELGSWQPYEHSLVKGHYNLQQDIYVVGIYNNDTFSGTDKLSMAVQPVFIDWVTTTNGATIIFEGDRLFNQSLFNQLACKIFILEADKAMIQTRHALRNDNQTEKFLKAKHTKIAKVKHNNLCEVLQNDNEQDLKLNVARILQYINTNKK